MHSGEQHFGIGRIEHAEQVGGVVGIHLLEHVGRAFGAQLRQHLGLLQLGQLLQDVGQPVVVERLEHLGAPLGRKPADGVGHVDRFASVELVQQLRHALAGHRQRRRRQALHVLPVHDVHRAAPSQPALAADGDPGHHPVAGSGLLDTQVGDHNVDAGQLRQFGIVDLHGGVEHLTQRQHLAGPLLEVAQRHVAGAQCHRLGLDRGDPQNRDENLAAGGQVDDQPQDARLLAHDADADHDIAHAPEGFAHRAEHQHPVQARHVHLVDRVHGWKPRQRRAGRQREVPARPNGCRTIGCRRVVE